MSSHTGVEFFGVFFRRNDKTTLSVFFTLQQGRMCVPGVVVNFSRSLKIEAGREREGRKVIDGGDNADDSLE